MEDNITAIQQRIAMTKDPETNKVYIEKLDPNVEFVESLDSPVVPTRETEFVTIHRTRLHELVTDALLLTALENGGVDNWPWYSDSIEEYFAEYRKDEDEEGIIGHAVTRAVDAYIKKIEITP